MPPPLWWRRVCFPVVRPFVCWHFLWRDIFLFSGKNSMKPCQKCSSCERENLKGFRGQKSKAKVVGSPFMGTLWMWDLFSCYGNFDETCYKYSPCQWKETKNVFKFWRSRSRSRSRSLRIHSLHPSLRPFTTCHSVSARVQMCECWMTKGHITTPMWRRVVVVSELLFGERDRRIEVPK